MRVILKDNIDDGNDLNVVGSERSEAIGLHSNVSGFTVWIEGDATLMKTIAALTELVAAKGLLPKTSALPRMPLVYADQPAALYPFHPLPELTTAAAVIYNAFVTSDGVERHAVAYVNDDGILLLEAIGSERSAINYAQFGTDDLRAMLALKEAH